MYCPVCHTRFDWRSGEIIQSVFFHNPHLPADSVVGSDPGALLMRATHTLLSALARIDTASYGVALAACTGLLRLHPMIKELDSTVAASDSATNPGSTALLCRQYCQGLMTQEELEAACAQRSMVRAAHSATLNSISAYYSGCQAVVHGLLDGRIGAEAAVAELHALRSRATSAGAATAERYGCGSIVICSDWEPASLGLAAAAQPQAATVSVPLGDTADTASSRLEVPPRIRQLMESPVQNAFNRADGRRPAQRIAPTAIMPVASAERLAQQRAALAAVRGAMG